MRVIDILVGQVPEGRTGYAHLCKIKEQYYSQPDVKDITYSENEALCNFFSQFFEINGFIKQETLPPQERDKLIFLKKGKIFRGFTTNIRGLPVKVSLQSFDYEDYEQKLDDEALSLELEGFCDQTLILHLVETNDKEQLEDTLEDIKEYAEECRIKELYDIEVDIRKEDLLKILEEFKKQPMLDYFLYSNIGPFLRQAYVEYTQKNPKAGMDETGRDIREKVLYLIDKIDWFEKELIKLYEEFLKEEQIEPFDDFLVRAELTEKGLVLVKSHNIIKPKRDECDRLLWLKTVARDAKEIVKDYKKSAIDCYKDKMREFIPELYAYEKQKQDINLFFYQREAKRLNRFLKDHAWVLTAFEKEEEEFQEELIEWARIATHMKHPRNEEEKRELFELYRQEKENLKLKLVELGCSLQEPTACEILDKAILLEEEVFITGIAHFIEGLFLRDTGQFNREDMWTDARRYEVEVRIMLFSSRSLEKHLDEYIQKAYHLAKEELKDISVVRNVDLIDKVVLKEMVLEWIYG